MNTNEKKFSAHSLVVTLAMCALVVMGISSIALFLAPNCSMARLTGWTFFGLTKDSWEALSTWFGFMALFSVVLYVAINRRQIIDFFTTGGKKIHREAAIALVISIILGIGSAADVGPFSLLMRWHEVNKHGAVYAGTGTHADGSQGCKEGGCGSGGCSDHGPIEHGSGEHGSCEHGSSDHGSHGACGDGNCSHADSE
jgi:hypothetical protein